MPIQLKAYRVKITFLTPVLGSQPNVDVATEYVAKKSGFKIPEDEVETLPDALDKLTTGFHRDSDGNPILFDYQVKGFLKEAGRILSGHVTGKVKNLRAKVNNLVFVTPRQIELHLPPSGEVDILERPLRAQTAQGPRVALTRSEMLPEGTRIEFALEVYPGQITENVLRDILDYGFHQGLGQWRNGGWGRFRYELAEEVSDGDG